MDVFLGIESCLGPHAYVRSNPIALRLVLVRLPARGQQRLIGEEVKAL